MRAGLYFGFMMRSVCVSRAKKGAGVGGEGVGGGGTSK